MLQCVFYKKDSTCITQILPEKNPLDLWLKPDSARFGRLAVQASCCKAGLPSALRAYPVP